MKSIKLLSLAMLCVAVMSSCTSRERKIQTLVTENLSQTLDEPTSLKIQTISQPDSAFGLRYFTPKEKGLIFKSVKDATEVSDGAYQLYDGSGHERCLRHDDSGHGDAGVCESLWQPLGGCQEGGVLWLENTCCLHSQKQVRMLLSGRAMVFHRQGLPDSHQVF